MIWLLVFLLLPVVPILVLQIARIVVEYIAEAFNLG
jgi:hypothetical protein